MNAEGAESGRRAGLGQFLLGVTIVGVLIAATYQVLVTNQEIRDVQEAELLGHETIRAGIDLLTQELREVSPSQGDLLEATPHEVAFRASRAFGITCSVDTALPLALTVANEGRPFEVGDHVFLLIGDPAEDEVSASSDDRWAPLVVSRVVGPTTCGEDRIPAQGLVLAVDSDETVADHLEIGGILRSWEAVRYHAGTIGADTHLVREVDGVVTPLVGPLDTESGFEIRYFDAFGDSTDSATEVATATVTLRTSSETGESPRPAGVDSLSTTVFFRN